MSKPNIEVKDVMKYSAFGVRDKEKRIERPYLNVTIFDKELALEVGQIIKDKLDRTLKNASTVADYQRARIEICAYEEYLEGIKKAFPEIQFISTERTTRE